MLEERSPFTALLAGPKTTAPNTTTCTSVEESAPEKTFSLRLRGRGRLSPDRADTALRSAEDMESST